MTDKLTDEEIMDVFNTFDVHGSKTLNIGELDSALRLLCIDLTNKQLEEKLQGEEIDTMSDVEFLAFVREKIGNVDFKDKCHQALADFDEQNTGKLSSDRLRQILTQMGDQPIDPDIADELIHDIDRDDIGIIDIEELVGFLYDQRDLFWRENEQEETGHGD